MGRVFSNGPLKDFVINPLRSMAAESTQLCIAAPFVTLTDDLVVAAKSGKSVCLLVGLNSGTSPEALSAVHGRANCTVRYFTRRFHAKIYLFDDEALVGSSNLTQNGLQFNREAMICVDQAEELDELRALFKELWDSAETLTDEKLKDFTAAYRQIKRPGPDLDTLKIEDAVGKSEPPNVTVGSEKKSTKGMFLEQLRRQVYEYRGAFREVTSILQENSLHHAELSGVGDANETNRFLSWVRRTHAPGEEWQTTPTRSQGDRYAEILSLGREWIKPDEDKIPENYIEWLGRVKSAFGSPDAIDTASKEQLTQGLMALHAFSEQLRFVKGGEVNLPTAFWASNSQDVDKARRTLKYLLHGGGEFVERLHDVLYDPQRKLGYFAKFCALELYGTIRPDDFAPVNGRIAKALRYLGFDVRGA